MRFIITYRFLIIYFSSVWDNLLLSLSYYYTVFKNQGDVREFRRAAVYNLRTWISSSLEPISWGVRYPWRTPSRRDAPRGRWLRHHLPRGPLRNARGPWSRLRPLAFEIARWRTRAWSRGRAVCDNRKIIFVNKTSILREHIAQSV